MTVPAQMGSLCISSTSTIYDALTQLNHTAQGILLIVDEEGRLIRTITDGDLRRLVLGGCTVDSSIDALPDRDPITTFLEDLSSDRLLKMNQYGVNQIVVVDTEGHPIDLIHRQDLDQNILLSTPHLGSDEEVFVSEAFQTNWIAPAGPNINMFEKELAAAVGARYAVAVSSGTAAIHLGLRLLEVGRGDLVFCSSFTFVASANPILYQGASPVFIDSEPESWNMSPAALSEALEDAYLSGKLPKAIIVVNLYGQSADLDLLQREADKYGVPIIEDAAESLGAKYKNKYSGTLGYLGVYSFNGNKIITTSGGGALITNDKHLADRAKFLATQAKESVNWYEHSVSGYNYRMSNILAGVGRGQLRVLSDRVLARRSIFSQYQRLLHDIPSISWMPEVSYGFSTRWLSTLIVNDPSVNVLDVVNDLAHEGIELRLLWKPLHLQPLFSGSKYFRHDSDYDVCANLFEKGLCLPSGSNLTERQQLRVVEALRRKLEKG